METRMHTLTLKARLRRDGSLSIPRSVRDELGLAEGDVVEVRLGPANESSPSDPLLNIIGIGKGGRPDAAKEHDTYLYGSDPL
jgi:bifunctional DNA-binding transcriptional regulator/antitoxin component of YhaV-PrlF toxin-antitoxin module